jgi:pyruvate dehydrogenase E2 component (dihydrolipoamide acetyltransferase)
MAGVKQPDDKSHFILPDLGEGVHEAELIKWRVKAGDSVKEHQTLAEMETDKALVEVPSPWQGVVSELCGNEGDIINVGNVLVRYDIGVEKSATPETSKKTATQGSSDEDEGTVVGTVSGELEVGDRFARTPEPANPMDNVNGNGKALATPAVRRIARELGVEIDRVSGTGRGGRVTATDVQDFAGATGEKSSKVTPESKVPAGFAPQVAPSPTNLPPIHRADTAETIPIRGVRRKIAEALSHSISTAVHFTVVDEANVTELDAKRTEYARVLGQKLSLLPFVMAAVCKALKSHPTLNSIVDDENSQILRKDSINLGCAVDTDHGLMVPVIHAANGMSIIQLSGVTRELARGCQDRSIDRDRLTGGTFTISNVGSYGGMFATPIINYPEVGILAVGRAKERVLAEGGRMFVGLVLPLSLSCDHRVVDGAEGARFLNTVVKLLEAPDLLIA